jgi:Spy/CpxP family protein refolding chaperone
MKFSKLQKFAWVFFALATASTTVFAQGWRNGNNGTNGQNLVCLEQISDLSEDQKSKIQELEKIHQEKMAELREQRRSTADAIEKNDIRGTMLRNVKAHREEVKNLLNEKQQKQYNELFTSTSKIQNQRGNGNFRGCSPDQGRQGFGHNQGYGRRGNQNFNGGCFRVNQPGRS